ncbi:MAG TPA: hypothetical protein VFJ43_15400, partial [Bacteroidia bacterium]|nr:hypothetical protein [Bacteroidia bacterium]
MKNNSFTTGILDRQKRDDNFLVLNNSKPNTHKINPSLLSPNSQLLHSNHANFNMRSLRQRSHL